jgi:hypothetical protein
MMKYLVPLGLTAAPLASVRPQQPQQAQHWAAVVNQADVRVELDTARVTVVDHQRNVWLRWTFPTAAPDFADVQIEGRDIDCAGAKTRIRSTRDASVFDGSPSLGSARIVTDSSAPWVRPSRGSLEALVVEAVCRWRTAGA